MVKGTGELGQGTSILTRLVKRPSGEGNIEQRLERDGKKKKAEKKMQRQRGMNWYAVFQEKKGHCG